MTMEKSSDRLLGKFETAVATFALDPAVKRSLLASLAAIADEEARLERERCVQICRARAELWTNTLAGSSPIADAREEARSRANEAMYIADLLTSEATYHTQPGA